VNIVEVGADTGVLFRYPRLHPQLAGNVGGRDNLAQTWTVGGTGVAASGQFLLGDEANLTAKTPAYFVLNSHTSYVV